MWESSLWAWPCAAGVAVAAVLWMAAIRRPGRPGEPAARTQNPAASSAVDPGQVARAAREISDATRARPERADAVLRKLANRYPPQVLRAALVRIEGSTTTLADWPRHPDPEGHRD